MKDPVVMSTSRLAAADLAAGILEERGIPFYRSCEAGGIRQAMPAAPADFPGVRWLIHVPGTYAEEASSVLASAVPPGDASAPVGRNWPGMALLVIAAALIAIPIVRACGSVVGR